MPEELTSYGYEQMRLAVLPQYTAGEEFQYVALLDENQNEITRIDTLNDTRATWTTTQSDQRIQRVELEVTGGDSDMYTPVTLQYTQSFGVGTDGTPLSPPVELSDVREFRADEDGGVITHNIQIPEV